MSAFTYAQLDDAFPNVTNAADRDVRYASPAKYQKIYRLDTGDVEQWDGASWTVIISGGLPVHLLSSGTGSPEGVVSAAVSALYLQTDGSHGTVIWVKNSGTGTTGWRPLQMTAQWVNPLEYGAVGNGVADDTAALTLALAAVPVGGTLYFPPGTTYKITSALTVATACTLWGYGATIHQVTASTRGLVVTASGVTILGVTLTGANSVLTATATEDAIYAVAPSEAAALTDLVVHGCTLQLWGHAAVWAQYLHRFHWAHNTVRTIGQVGIGGYSIQLGTIAQNLVDTVGTGVNHYGIQLSRADVVSLVTDPRSQRITVTGNIVTNCPFWEGIDTHGGQDITITGNTVQGCFIGISASDGNFNTYAPQDVSIVGNTIDSGVTDGSFREGIVFSGAGTVTGTPVQNATGAITGNRIKGHGLQSNGNSGALLLQYTEGVTVSGNSFGEPSPYAIAAYHDNYGLTLNGNTATDPWSTTSGAPALLAFISDYNVAHVTGNTARLGAKIATHVLVNGIRINASTGSRISLGFNDVVDATTPINNVSGLATVLGPETVSNDLGDADYTAQCGLSPTWLTFATALTGNRTVTLSTTNAVAGARFRVIRTGLGNFTLSVGGLKTIPSATAATVDVVFRGGAWRLAGYGILVDPAPLASPVFTGTPSLPTGTTGVTQTPNDNSTKLATTAYVDRATTHTGTTSAAPTGTTSATAVMMGLAGSITPTRGTKIIFMASGQMANSTINDGATVDLRFGTGGAPTNGAAVTGTLVGIAQTATSLVAASRSGWHLQGKVTGLTVGTAYWFDVSLLAVTGGTATVTGVSLVAWEVP